MNNNQLIAQFFTGMTREDIANREYKVAPIVEVTPAPVVEGNVIDIMPHITAHAHTEDDIVEIPSFIGKDYKGTAYTSTKTKPSYNIVVR